MDNYDGVGRIPRQAFLVSTSLLLAVCLVSVVARYYIRIVIQKEFALDDAFLAFGTACMITAMAVLYTNMDNMYLTEALIYSPALLATGSPDLNGVFEFGKLVKASLILTWVAMMAVKFSFLALFKRLIDRMPGLLRYWWFVVAFNLAVTGYGASVYFVACPDIRGTKASKFFTLDDRGRLSLDDLIVLHSRVSRRSNTTQDRTICSIPAGSRHLRRSSEASGLEWKGNLDVLWEVYFQIIAAEVGLILVAVTAFRQLFVSRINQNRRAPPKSPPFWTGAVNTMRGLLDPRRWTSSYSGYRNGPQGRGSERKPKGLFGRLPDIPGATMTGVRTFIDEHSSGTEGNRDTSPLVAAEKPAISKDVIVCEHPKGKRSELARPLVSTTGNDTITSVIGLYQDRSPTASDV
ncbi:MAG: hypothetical protein LQ348_002764 [Seirophora lacunosa]|nr:MAG: hypothetical protein LQ348_002764 [Seirophora lacunosa]